MQTAKAAPPNRDGDTMSMATRTDTQSPALHVGDGYDLICVQGARCPSLFTQVPRREILRT
jgi:hypothetical protein